MCVIVTCYILQARGNDWNYVWNVGVQAFFLLDPFFLMSLYPAAGGRLTLTVASAFVSNKVSMHIIVTSRHSCPLLSDSCTALL